MQVTVCDDCNEQSSKDNPIYEVMHEYIDKKHDGHKYSTHEELCSNCIKQHIKEQSEVEIYLQDIKIEIGMKIPTYWDRSDTTPLDSTITDKL